MIEINLPTEAAVNLLHDQFLLEFKRQQKISKINYDISVEDLSASEFRNILEIALFDILALLPVTIVTSETNLPEIIAKSVKGVAFKFGKKSLFNYSQNEAKSMLSLVKKSFGDFKQTTTYQNN